MSYTFYIRDAKTGRDLYWGNYTSNIYNIVQGAFKKVQLEWQPQINKNWTHWTDGLLYTDRPIKYLEKLILEIENNKEYYRLMNPKNGWGNCDNFVEFLSGILNRLKDYEEKDIVWVMVIEC